MSQKVHYINNRELFREVLLCKASYSEFIDDKYIFYDNIVKSVDDINDDVIRETKEMKVSNFALNNQKDIRSGRVKPLVVSELTKEDLVFRIMTNEHIPDEIIQKSRTVYQLLKFPPFKHYAFIGDDLVEVGRSHWDGGIQNGYFVLDKGKLSEKLITSCKLLTGKYAEKWNWNRYTYIHDMEAQALLQLIKVVLQFDESRFNNVFSYLTTVVHTSFLKVIKDEQKSRQIRDELIFNEGFQGSFASQDEDTHSSTPSKTITKKVFYNPLKRMFPNGNKREELWYYDGYTDTRKINFINNKSINKKAKETDKQTDVELYHRDDGPAIQIWDEYGNKIKEEYYHNGNNITNLVVVWMGNNDIIPFDKWTMKEKQMYKDFIKNNETLSKENE